MTHTANTQMTRRQYRAVRTAPVAVIGGQTYRMATPNRLNRKGHHVPSTWRKA